MSSPRPSPDRPERERRVTLEHSEHPIPSASSVAPGEEPDASLAWCDAAQSLRGQTAVVTGASSGIGLATALLLARSGAHVAGLARREPEPDAVTEDSARDLLRFHRVDVTDQQAVADAVSKIASEGPIDILICAAGTNVPQRGLTELSVEDWDEIVSTNLSGAFYAINAALPFIPDSTGRVILISSVSAAWPDASGVAYQASKAGMSALGRAAGFEAHRRGIRFSTVAPGMVNTAMQDRRPVPTPREVRSQSLAASDVARVCLFLSSLPDHVHVPELTVFSTRLQALGKPPAAVPASDSAASSTRPKES